MKILHLVHLAKKERHNVSNMQQKLLKYVSFPLEVLFRDGFTADVHLGL